VLQEAQVDAAFFRSFVGHYPGSFAQPRFENDWKLLNWPIGLAAPSS
jgi:hypothetical protein